MKVRTTVILGLVSVGVLWGGLVFSKEVLEGPTIKLERAVYFLSADGTNTVLAPGMYGVGAKDGNVINVTTSEGGTIITIQAEVGIHEEQLSAPEAVAVVQEEDLFHLVLLMPGGKTLDALGTFSGVRTRGSMTVPLQPQQLSQLALRPVPLAATALVQAPGSTPQMSQTPPASSVPMQLPSQLQTQPLQSPNPRQPLPQTNPQLDPCIQIVYDGGVKIDLKAVATGPSSVNLTWSGFPGRYDISTTGPRAGFHASTILKSVRTLDRSGQLQSVQGALTHAPALPAFQYHYAITGTLADGRKACGSASATTLPEPFVGQVLAPPVPLAALWGWVDLHTHPMSNLAFGGKLFHGGPDAGSRLPAIQMPYDPQCRFDVRAINMEEALSDDAPTHGDVFQSKCGNSLRQIVISQAEKGGLQQPGHAVGAPTFINWPKWNDITHQKMWWEWIKRAKDGGLRVMVALSHNNRTLADVTGPGGPISGVTDDVRSSDLQMAEIKAFVSRHSSPPDGFMEVALSAADVERIVRANKLAIVLGVEIDNIGNFNQFPTIGPGMVEGEIQRLYNQGVRYIFPIHLTDNVFGGTAIYNNDFNWANYRESLFPSPLLLSPRIPGAGNFWKVECAFPPAPPFPGDEIGFKAAIDTGDSILSGLQAPIRFAKLGIPVTANPPVSPACPVGHRNAQGLTPLGELAIKEMMKRGMIIDIDHMSHKSAERALQIAEGIPGGGYPLMSGHSGIRVQNLEHSNAENSRTRTQLARIGCLQGMFGLGTDGADAYDWAGQYAQASTAMQCPSKTSFGPGSVAFGTDMNSLVRSPRPTLGPDLKPGSRPRASVSYDTVTFPISKTGVKTWDYKTEGVAHYGLLADFVTDVRTAPVNQGMSGADLVDNHLMHSADYFWRMWQKIEAQKVNVH